MPPLFESKVMSNAPLAIRGGRPLTGRLEVYPAKNAALPVIVASLLSSEPITLHGVPRLADVECILEIVATLGAKWEWLGRHSLRIHTPELTAIEAPYALVSKMRASFVVLGAVLARAGEARVSMPGGCAFGPRPVDQHVKAFRAMGATVVEEGGDFHALRDRPLTGRFVFDLLTVGGTQNAILAATLGTGLVRLENASIDPDVVDLVEFLNGLGARISGAGTHTIEIEGVERLGGGEYRVIPDRLEAGTFMLAAAATRGDLTLEGVKVEHMRALSAKLTEAGVRILELDGHTLRVDARRGELRALSVHTAEFPGFPTDLQPTMGAFLATVPGTSKLSDRIYPDRFGYVQEMARMGARMELIERVLVVEGGPLHGAPVKAPDIRAGAALVVAALAAEGETVISGVEYLNRGYEDLQARLRGIGADAMHLEPALAKAL
jgi:UDP-N-acetylglucosamine 1-carboxyvinyltransferase